MNTIKNLNQLKKALKVGTRFKVIEHFRKEFVGVTREVTESHPTFFYTKNAYDKDDKINSYNDNKGLYMRYGGAKNWEFRDDGIYNYLGDVHNPERFIMKIILVDEHSPME